MTDRLGSTARAAAGAPEPAEEKALPAVGRLTEVAVADLGPRWPAVRRRIAATHSGRIDGPYAVLARVPALAEAVSAVEEHFRLVSSLPAAERELVTLVTARRAGAEFCWAVHEAAGARREVVEAIRGGERCTLEPREKLLVELAEVLAGGDSPPAALYRRAVAELGEDGLVEIVALVGHYRLVALLLAAFEVPPPPDSLDERGERR